MATTYEYTILKHGPVAYWRLGESSGTTAVDETGSYDGTYVNTPTLGATGLLVGDGDTAVAFTAASSERMSVWHNTTAPAEFQSIGNAGDDYTVAFLFSSTDGAGTETSAWWSDAQIIELRENVPTTLGIPFSIGLDTNKIKIGFNDNATDTREWVFTNGTYNDGNPHFVVCTVDNEVVTIYVDGTLDVQDTLTQATGNRSVGTSNSSLTIGARTMNDGSPTNYLNGTIDEVAIFDYALTPAQVSEQYLVGQGLFDDYPLTVRKYEPVAYWRLGDASGTTAVDETGNHDGTYVNSPTLGATGLLAGDNDTAVTFDGSNQFVDITTALTGSGGAIALLFKADTLPSTQYLFGVSDDASTNRFLGVATYDSKLALHLDNGGVWTRCVSSQTINTGEIYHIVIQSDGNQYEMYINGISENVSFYYGSNTGDWFSDISGLDQTSIGALNRSSLAAPFDGTIDEVAIFDYALTDQEIADIYAAGAYPSGYARETMRLGPVAYWRLGESSGTTAVDETGNHDGTYVNTPTLGATGALAGDGDTAITLDGVNQHVTAPMSSGFAMSGDFTISAWVKTQQATAFRVVYAYDPNTSQGYSIGSNGSGIIRFYMWGSVLALDGSTNIADDQWHYIVCKRDGANAYIYVDGNEDASSAVATPVVDPSGDTLYIGVDRVLANDFTGTIDEVAIFDYALTPDQVAHLYAVATTLVSSIIGTVNLDSAPYGATIRCYLASDGSLVQEVTCDSQDGTYILTGLMPDTEYYVMAIDGAGVRPLVHGPVTGE